MEKTKKAASMFDLAIDSALSVEWALSIKRDPSVL